MGKKKDLLEMNLQVRRRGLSIRQVGAKGQGEGMNHDFSKLPDIFARHPQDASSLIMILQDIQKEYRYLPCEALKETASKTAGSA